jgi:hypothetical protein
MKTEKFGPETLKVFAPEAMGVFLQQMKRTAE